MDLEFDHSKLVEQIGLLIEKDARYGLAKYFVPWGDRKTDLIGPFYPDVTCLRREGKVKMMIELLTPYSFEDSDEVRRLESLSTFCAANNWEFYIAVPNEETRKLTKSKIDGKGVTPKALWTLSELPFVSSPPKAAHPVA